MEILNIRENPNYLEEAVEFFSKNIKISRNKIFRSIEKSIKTDRPLPRWFIIVEDGTIVGGCSLQEYDNMVEIDKFPWLVAICAQPEDQREQLERELLFYCRREAAKLGFSEIYATTTSIGYFERYGWHYIGDYYYHDGTSRRVYFTDGIYTPEEMASFFDKRAGSYNSHMLDDIGMVHFYESLMDCFKKPPKRILDLGCGTGIELERIFERYPNISVTGIDLSQGMLDILEERYKGKDIKLLCGSYFDLDFEGTYDYVISTYSLHHFTRDNKEKLYRKIYDVLEPGGYFIFGDYTVETSEQELSFLLESEKLRKEYDIEDNRFFHIDLPFTYSSEIKLMEKVGFKNIELIKHWFNASIIIAHKE